MEVRIIKCGSLGDFMSFIEDEMGREILAMMGNDKEDVNAGDRVASNTVQEPQKASEDKRQTLSARAEKAILTERNEDLIYQLKEARDEITKLCVEKADLKSRVRSLEDYAMRVERITGTSPLLKERCPHIPACDKNETAPRTV